MCILPKVIYRFIAIPVKIPLEVFIEIEKIILKFISNHRRPQIAKAILRKNNKGRGITIPNFKLYHKAIVTKTVCHWHKNGHIEIWNTGQTSEINAHISTQLIFDKRTKNPQWAKIVSSIKGFRKTGYSHKKKKRNWASVLHH